MTSGKYPHPFAARTIEICEIIEANGPIGIGRLADRVGSITKQNLSTTCLGLLNAGVLTVIKGEGHAQSHNQYSAAPGWRDIVAERANYVRKPFVRVRRYERAYAPNGVIPITEQGIEVCEVLDKIHRGTCTKIANRMEEATADGISRTCAYLAKQGLIVEVGVEGRSNIYACVKNWREIVKAREAGYRLPDPGPTQWTGITSVFDMARKFSQGAAA